MKSLVRSRSLPVSLSVSLSASIGLLALGACGSSSDSSSTPAKTLYGVTCAASGTGGWDIVQDSSHTYGNYILDTNGSTVTAITFHQVNTFSGSYSNETLTVVAKTCGFTGTTLGTASTTLTTLGVSSNAEVTFTFPTPLTVPTCTSGHKTVTFAITASSLTSGDHIYAAPTNGSGCVQNTPDQTAPLGSTTYGSVAADVSATQ